MSQKIIKIFLIIFSIYMVNASFAKIYHSQKFSKYPYGLLGDDFGVLKVADLAANACMASPVPFTNELSAYAYWQCFETKKARLLCDGYGYDEDAKDFLTALVAQGTNDSGRHEYVSRRAISFGTCKSLKREWEKLTKDEKYVCISGPFTSIQKLKNNQKSFLWTFDKFKTKKGCASYFYGDCSLKYQLKNGCKIKKTRKWVGFSDRSAKPTRI